MGPPEFNRLTNMSENITFPQTTCAGAVKIITPVLMSLQK